MFQLICTVLSLSLFAAALFTSVSYLNPVATQGQVIAERLESDFNDLKDGFETYLQSNGLTADTLAQLTPEYVFLPPAPGETAWSYGGAGTGRYFCLSGDFGPASLRAVLSLERAFSPQAYFINATCGATADAKPANDAAGFDGAVTLWVSSYQ